jgi:hypothetical protein
MSSIIIAWSLELGAWSLELGAWSRIPEIFFVWEHKGLLIRDPMVKRWKRT